MTGVDRLPVPSAALAPQADWRAAGDREHFVQFYEHDAFLAAAVAEYVAEGLSGDAAGIVIATGPHREAIEQHLQARGVDVRAAHRRGQYIALDAADTLSQFMQHGWPDDGRFGEIIGRVIADARCRYTRVRAFGEMVALLWAEGNLAAAVQLEELWNALGKKHAFALFCAYPMSGFDKEGHDHVLGQICHAHSRTLPAESYAQLGSPQERLLEITQLQRKATALDTAVVERAAAERALSRREMELAQANRRQDEFLAMLSHELREPLSAIGTAVRLMHQAGDDPRTIGRVREIIDRQVRRMTRLADDLLDVSRISHGKLQLREQRVPLAAPVDQAVELAEPVAPLGDASAARARSAAQPHRRLLVVDDNLDAAEALTEYLRRAGHYVEVAHDGTAALEAAARMRPEIAILDIGMPDLDGYEVAWRLRAEVGLAGSLLVALTGFGDERDRRRADDAGFDHYFVKPVNLDKLEQLVDEWCPRTGAPLQFAR